MHLRNLDERGGQLLTIGVAGLVGAGVCLWALLFPALGVLFVLDENHVSGLAAQVFFGAVVFVATGVIAGALVVCGAAVRMTATGSWPGRRFMFGVPGVAIAASAFAFTALLASVL
jgi:hypothetical protein